ncbi:MAG TPA: hypothetical protein VE153_23990 [Myxococcus sp.]|nr:hypothetical protein [Myxococcus sp.]
MSPQPSPQAFVPRPSSPRLGALASLQRGALAAGAAVTLAGCTGAQVRADATRCTLEALECMRKQLDLKPGGQFTIFINEHQDDFATFHIQDGAAVVSITRQAEGRLPVGTRVYGRLWTGEKNLVGQYTRAQTPDGRSYPVCFALEMGKVPGPQPAGGAHIMNGAFLTVVEKFPSDK